jgi:hypothetical protein
MSELLPRGGIGTGRHQSATDRMHGARRSTKAAITRELLLVAILARSWDGSHTCHVPTGEAAVCLHASTGDRLIWRLLDEEERALFAFLPALELDAPDPKGLNKLATLLALATA